MVHESARTLHLHGDLVQAEAFYARALEGYRSNEDEDRSLCLWDL